MLHLLISFLALFCSVSGNAQFNQPAMNMEEDYQNLNSIRSRMYLMSLQQRANQHMLQNQIQSMNGAGFVENLMNDPMMMGLVIAIACCIVLAIILCCQCACGKTHNTTTTTTTSSSGR